MEGAADTTEVDDANSDVKEDAMASDEFCEGKEADSCRFSAPTMEAVGAFIDSR